MSHILNNGGAKSTKYVILDQDLTCHGKFLSLGYTYYLGREREKKLKTAFSEDSFINFQEAICRRVICL